MLIDPNRPSSTFSSAAAANIPNPLAIEEICEILSFSNVPPKDADNMLQDENAASSIIKHGLELFGMISPASSDSASSSNVWRRCLVTTALYSTPYLPCQTTLVPLSLVPLPIRKKLGMDTATLNGTDSHCNTVEIPVSYLLPEVITASPTTNSACPDGKESEQQQHPLQLYHPKQDMFLTASKLRDYYIRGGPTSTSSNSSKVFHASNVTTNENYTTAPEALKQSLQDIISMSDIEAYKKGLLLTAPPGVSKSYVGLTPQIVYPTLFQDNTYQATEKFHDSDYTFNVMRAEEEYPPSSYMLPKVTPNNTLWEKLLLGGNDDDSLFGSVSSTSSSDSDDDLSKKEQVEQRSSSHPQQEIVSTTTTTMASSSTSILEHFIEDAANDEMEDIGELLDSLLVLDDSKYYTAGSTDVAVPKRGGVTPATASSAGSRLAKSPTATTTSSSSTWAITTELDITDFGTRVVPNLALSFPFELDGFQKQAVARLERDESIFVAAHTSAGKTVCAEYAIALSQKRCTRTIYTSPIKVSLPEHYQGLNYTVCIPAPSNMLLKTPFISHAKKLKALSNQKYRDFCTKFGTDQIGLITGDTQVNPAAPCLIMTTEILRSMLYRGADLVRDIEFVVFDECHYVNDTERGVVWEEVIIMLPDYVKLVFLSATTPNAIEFCDWIGRTKRKHIYVIRTNYRPVPLTHYLYTPSTGTNQKVMHVIMEGDTTSRTSGFLKKGYMDAVKALSPSSATKDSGANKGGNNNSNNKKPQAPQPKPAFKSGPKQSTWKNQGNKGQWISFIRFLEREELTPSVIFSFSKKKCEDIALSLRSLDLNSASERAAVTGFTEQTIKRLNPSDAALPQVTSICEMVKRGISTHHGGLLPILKEMVEILFSRNLIKVLFATETFAMGVNMPARSVAFSAVKKHDGSQFRNLLPGEYIQMSGRAGRRGLDKVGTVIITCFGEEPPPQVMLNQILTGTSTRLQSQFRLTYNMILNLLRVEDMSVEDMIKRSFSEFATQRALDANNYPKLLLRGRKTLAKLENEHEFQVKESGSIIGAQDIGKYFLFSSQLLRLNFELHSQILLSAGGGGGGALVRGRVLLVTNAHRHGYVRTPAIVLRPPSLCTFNSKSPTPQSPGQQQTGINAAVCLVLLPYDYQKMGRDEKAEKSTNQRTRKRNKKLDTSSEIGTLNYVGMDSRGRHYAIHEVKLTDIFLVSALQLPIDSKAIFRDSSSMQNGNGDSRVSNDSFFGKARVLKRDEDAFAGLAPRGKKGAGRAHEHMHNSQKGVGFDPSQYYRHIDKIVSMLVDVEAKESSSTIEHSSLDLLDLRAVTAGVQKGEDYLSYRSSCDRMEDLVRQCRSCQSHSHPNLSTHYTHVERLELLRARINQLERVLSNESLSLFPDFIQRKAVLQTLGYVDRTTDAVCLKGRIACEVNSCESLIVTELLLDGILNELEPAEIVSVLSTLLAKEKLSDDEDGELDNSDLPLNLIRCCNRIKSIAVNFGALQREHGLLIEPSDYADEMLNFGLVHVVYEWALGVPFCNICELTAVPEGSIVRCITRLDELCREVRNCARVLGNPSLYFKMEAASAAIKRDIVFASSLYVS